MHTDENTLQDKNTLPHVVALVGPTGVGKTELSLRLAELLNAEIISADSMQVYRGMNIGTAKASHEEQARAPHHLLDLLDPDQSFSVARYQELARKAISEITARGALPLFVGGTGLYLRAALEPYQFTPLAIDTDFREHLHLRAESEGSAALHLELAEIDPASAAKLHYNDLRRIIRALEVYHYTGKPISDAQRRTEQAPPLYRTLWIGLSREREELYARIDRRVEQMVASGLLEEVAMLRAKGWGQDSVAGQALGYKEFWPCLDGHIPLQTAIATLQQETRRYAKRQLSWFRAAKQIVWYDLVPGSKAEDYAEEIADLIERFIS